jgi:hypothetical protein
MKLSLIYHFCKHSGKDKKDFQDLRKSREEFSVKVKIIDTMQVAQR